MSNSCYNPFIYGIYSVSIAFLSGNSTAHDQSWARDNTATNPWPCFQSKICFDCSIMAIFVAATPLRHRSLNFSDIFLSLKLNYVVAVSRRLTNCHMCLNRDVVPDKPYRRPPQFTWRLQWVEMLERKFSTWEGSDPEFMSADFLFAGWLPQLFLWGGWSELKHTWFNIIFITTF